MNADRVLGTAGGLAGIGGIWAAVHAAAPDGVTFSAGALSVTAILLAIMATVVATLFRMLLDLYREAMRLAERGTGVIETIADKPGGGKGGK